MQFKTSIKKLLPFTHTPEEPVRLTVTRLRAELGHIHLPGHFGTTTIETINSTAELLLPSGRRITVTVLGDAFEDLLALAKGPSFEVLKAEAAKVPENEDEENLKPRYRG